VTCRELTDFIADYLSGELTPTSKDEFDSHLGLCPNCRQYLADYQATVRLGKKAFVDDGADVPADVPEDLVRAILAARRSR
jgi:anti-sigma factor RsiW